MQCDWSGWRRLQSLAWLPLLLSIRGRHDHFHLLPQKRHRPQRFIAADGIVEQSLLKVAPKVGPKLESSPSD
jgi:hypothetical protein